MRMGKQTIKTNKLTANEVSTALMRQAVLSMISGSSTVTRDLDGSCGYPMAISTADYKRMYDRQGIATRVVQVFPEESWAVVPDVYETENPDETLFEKEWKKLCEEKHLLSVFSRVDILSGIGRFGVILLGIDDGLELYQPVDNNTSFPERLEEGAKPGKQHKLLYLKVYSEASVKIDEVEKDPKNSRYGYPTIYSIQASLNDGDNNTVTSTKVHWSRIIHIADNREESDVCGVPRLKNVYNYCLDTKKVLGGSGEMFWKGGFPGLSFEAGNMMNVNEQAIEIDTESITEALESYQQGLQRFLIAKGGKFTSLAPQVADPTNHLTANIKAVAMAKGIPYRIFLGSEEAKLASSEDKKTWNGRIVKRQNDYLTPFVIRPTIDRLVVLGVLPAPKGVFVEWPDLNTPSETEKATVTSARTEALAKYVNGNVDQLVPPKQYLTMFMGMTDEEAEAIEQAALEYEPVLEEEEEHQLEMQKKQMEIQQSASTPKKDEDQE